MLSQFVVSAILACVVFGGLAFHDAIVDRIAAIDRTRDTVEFEVEDAE